MEKFWRKKWFKAALLLIMVALAAFLYFQFFFKKTVPENPPGPPSLPGQDAIPPVSTIVSPEPNSFSSGNFLVKVWDMDSGGSDLDPDQCRYSVYNCSFADCAPRLVDEKRTCDDNIVISVGEKGDCYMQGPGACQIIVKSKDRAQNPNLPSAEENSISDFGVDWTAPGAEILTSAFLPRALSQTILARVSDNVEVANCDFYIDSQSQYQACLKQGKEDSGCLKQFDFSPATCSATTTDKCYTASRQQTFLPGAHKIYLACWDTGGNTGYSPVADIEILVNHPPEISLCKVNPSQGGLATDFEFQADVFDPDSDELSYLWEFGDGIKSQEYSPIHQYVKEGVYQPRLTVSDSKEKVQCSTAWVSVGQE